MVRVRVRVKVRVKVGIRVGEGGGIGLESVVCVRDDRSHVTVIPSAK